MKDLQKAELKILEYFIKFTEEKNINYFLYAGTLLGAIRHQGFIPWDDDVDVILKRDEFERFENLFINSNYKNDGLEYQSRKLDKYYANSFSKIRSRDINIYERISTTQNGYIGPWIDIFVYDNIPNDLKSRKEQFSKVSKYNKLISFFLLTSLNENDYGLKRYIKKIVQSINERFYHLYFFLPFLFMKRNKYQTMYNDKDTKQSADLGYMFYENFDDYAATFIDNMSLESYNITTFEDVQVKIPLNHHAVLTTLYGNYMEIPNEDERKVHRIHYGQSEGVDNR